jgi:hypothetical protein
MAFHPDVAVAVVVPVAIHPLGMRVGRLDVSSGNPDIGVTVPAMIAGVPCPIRMLMGWGRDMFDGTRRRTDTDDDLSLGDTCG